MKQIRILFMSVIVLLLPNCVEAQKTKKVTPEPIEIDPLNEHAHKKRAFKATPLAFFLGYTGIAYEKSLEPKRSFEVRVNLIGLGIKYIGQVGAAVTTGYKFIFLPTTDSDGGDDKHSLSGWYFRPEISLSSYFQTYNNAVYEGNVSKPVLQKDKTQMSYLTVMPTIGRQKVTESGFVYDFFLGIGYAAVYPMNNKNMGDYAHYGSLIKLNKATSQKLGFAPSVKVGFLVGGVFK